MVTLTTDIRRYGWPVIFLVSLAAAILCVAFDAYHLGRVLGHLAMVATIQGPRGWVRESWSPAPPAINAPLALPPLGQNTVDLRREF